MSFFDFTKQFLTLPSIQHNPFKMAQKPFLKNQLKETNTSYKPLLDIHFKPDFEIKVPSQSINRYPNIHNLKSMSDSIRIPNDLQRGLERLQEYNI